MSGEKQPSLVSRINDILATRITMWVGTIWAFYAFALFGLTPVFWPNYEEQILYWSNFLQLVFLPIITVGTALMSRGTLEQQAEGHEIVKKEFALMQETHDQLMEALKQVDAGMKELLRRGGESALSPSPEPPAKKPA
jgi:hypothetical protein